MSDKSGGRNNNRPPDSVIDARIESWFQSKANAEISSGSQEEIVRMLRPSLAAVNPIPPQGKLIATFVGIFVLCVAAAIPAVGWVGIHLMTRVQIAYMVATFVAGALLFSSTLASQMVPGSVMRVPLGVVLGLSSAALIGGIALVFPWHILGSFTSEGWGCAVLELGVAAPAAGLFWVIVRRGAPFRGAGLGAAVAGLSVFLALTVVQSQCMYPQAPHILVWHAGVAALLIVCGALAGLASRRFHMPPRNCL